MLRKTLILLTLLASQATAQTVVDPGFESPALAAGKFQYRPAGSAWSFTGGGGLSANSSGFTVANPAAPQGNQIALLQATGQITQTVAGWPAGSFQIVFKAAQRNYPATGSSQILSVLVDGQVISSIQPGGIAYATYYTPGFSVAAGDHVLSFATSSTTGDYTAFLDAVSIIPAGSIPPKVATSAAVATSGKMISLTFTAIADGKPVVPSQVLAAPSITVNGQSLGPCGVQWVTGYHPVALIATPSSYQVRPGDQVRVSAPIGWAFSAAGSVAALDSVLAENRTGKPMIATEALPRTLRIGVNNNQVPTSPGTGFYFPFKNLKYRAGGWPPSNRGKLNVPAVTLSLSHNGMPNGIDNTRYPGVAGLWCVMWDAAKPTTPIQFAIASNTPTQCSITERPDLARAPPDGVGMCRVFDVQPVAGPVADFDVSLSLSDPAWQPGQANYSNLWVVQPGDFDIVNGAVSLDRSDPLALSRIYLDRVGPNIGSMRWVDSTICGGNPQSIPYPEMMPSMTDESWGDTAMYWQVYGYTAAGPVDVTATPYIYSPFFRQPDQQFQATLADDITTTPATGTAETYTFPDADTAPLMAGLEITADSEVMRILTVSGSSVKLYRGSGGTTPAIHAAGPVSVSGRRPITDVTNANGGMPKALVMQFTTAAPHGRTTGNIFNTYGANWPTVTCTDGSTWNPQGMSRHGYVTGPNTFFWAIQSAKAGGVPDRVYPLNPAVQQFSYQGGGGIPIEAAALATGRFARADFHVNVPMDACDDMVWEIARRVLANFPAGRRVYVEYANEPWNWAFTGFYYHSAVMPLAVPGGAPYQLAHYAMRAGQVQSIFRKVFDQAGRAGEIRGLINCQMGSGASQITPALEYGLKLGTPFDAVGIGPYWSLENTPYNQRVAGQLDDEQLIDVLMADQRSNPRTNNAWITDASGAIAKYNAAHGSAVQLYGYEGGIETAHPWGAARNHDLIYNPLWYHAELDWIAWCQNAGFDRINIYNHAMWWNPEGWGGYHTSQQRHSRGDGVNGAARNLDWKRTVRPPGSNQDLHVDAIRPQAWLDWLGTLAP